MGINNYHKTKLTTKVIHNTNNTKFSTKTKPLNNKQQTNTQHHKTKLLTKLTHRHNKISSKYKKSNDIFRTPLEPKNKPILSLNTMLEQASQLSTYPLNSKTIYGDLTRYSKFKRVQINPLLSNLVRHVANSGFTNPFCLRFIFSYVQPRTLRKYFTQLRDLKWIIKVGMCYEVNPFLKALLRLDQDFCFLYEYASFKIDLFDLLNIPLMNLLELRKQNPRMYQVKKVKVVFHPFTRGSQSLGVRTVFYGVVGIRLSLKNDKVCETVLPVNYHAQPKIKGYNKDTKKRIMDLSGIDHYCIPLNWSIFDVVKPSYYSQKRRKKRWDKNLKPFLYVHFDNSISILYQPDYYTYSVLTKPFIKAIKKWNGEEYVEFNEFEVLERLFHARFVKNKRRANLFQDLGLTSRKMSGRPRKQLSSSKPVRKRVKSKGLVKKTSLGGD